MHDEYKRQSPYRGLGFLILMLVVPQIICYVIISAALKQYSPWGPVVDDITARAIGYGVGVVFHLMVIVSGAVTAAWQAVKYRVREFCENLIVGFGYACRSYWDDVRTDGVNLLVFLAIMVTNALLALDAVKDFLDILPLL